MNNKAQSIMSAAIAAALLLASHGPAYAQQTAPFVSDVPLVQPAMLSPAFWLKQQADKAPLMSERQIQAFNRKLIANNPYVTDPLTYADELSRDELIQHLQKASSTPSSPRFYTDGRQLTDEDFARYHANTNKTQVQDMNKVRFGMVVERTSLRTFPTDDRVLNAELDADLDRFQESGAFPGEAVAVLHESTDGQWYLVAAYNYTAWVKKAAIAIGDKDTIVDYTQAKDFVVVSGDKVDTSFVPNKPRVSEVQLDMGVRLVLMPQEGPEHLTHGQNSFASYIVKLPVRNKDGSLAFEKALLPRSSDVSVGYLPLTEHNLIAQGFKFLGERYGWGHDYNARDCTGFVGEIYKTFGLMMPRNSSWQGKGDYGYNWRFDEGAKLEQKQQVLAHMQVGDLIYIPGHVMMYIGDYQGQPYVIHDVKGIGYLQGDGGFYEVVLNGVSVTPLLPLHLDADTSYLDKTYAIKRIAPGGAQ
ncbi:SH3 domain-containing protein [Pseudoalteromonas sp. BDTF-M6]|uniref:SH3 domain-containing protein n=1 Tax=Pseudoalteromonas sp. BDTF-M6 TaxID=2796132 RepID=UPI001BB0C683|nr:SH3 domain-containing protein [Pseudoalteromonas sp. BDTF-M6]MBS3798981.1 SH3 domain-containing protein [Pseudoalteromonas sp. BDTF-M6]